MKDESLRFLYEGDNGCKLRNLVYKKIKYVKIRRGLVIPLQPGASLGFKEQGKTTKLWLGDLLIKGRGRKVKNRAIQKILVETDVHVWIAKS